MARPLHLPAFFKEEDFEALYKTHGQKKHGVRLLALQYLQKGKSVKGTATLFLKTENTIKGWIDLYEEGGLENLLSIRSGRGRKSKLSDQEEISLKDEIAKLTDSLKGGRIRAEDIKQLILCKFNIEYGLSGIYPLLDRLGYSWVTARSIHPQADKDLQTSFKK